ncbi:metal-dependent hydrolase [Acidovorax sp. NCPPB 3576]|uniref:metal-dependent hydrolase n=1 Tax=Acidovorax sp. NCPPB 3576 TaxID=2940488 RepID=UPI00234912DE|nr:metal-dependent hydrolase [Acidovorax sp. NCPPB 3576]WCM90321.1 metal-dependent hydrolase [Acidovorax sp. NCPPB 3576]
MDSLTQIALGSAVSLAVMGRRTAPWKAALWGAVAGTLPDLDAFIDHGNAIADMVQHRAESHALLYLSLFSLPLGALVARLHGEQAGWRRWWLAMWLALITHPLLDAMTVYGTQLWKPFTSHPYGVGSIFIIDPLYTVPLIVGVVAALVSGAPLGARWNRWGLALSTLYLAWSVGVQQHVTGVALQSLHTQGLPVQTVLVTPTPFNTLLWRVVAVTPTQYAEGFYALADGKKPMQWTVHERGAPLISRYQAVPAVQQVARFSHGFYRMRARAGRVLVTDLRMGQEPDYTFQFDLGTPEQLDAGQPDVALRGQRPTDIGTALAALWRRMWGHSGGSGPFGADVGRSSP